MKIIQCQNCGKDTKARDCEVDRKKYCSKKCMAEAKGYGDKPIKTCLNCGNEYKTIKAKAERSRYCSKSCLDEHKKCNFTEERVCRICGTRFISLIEKSREHLCCSPECAKIAQRTPRKKRDSKIAVNCATCGKLFKIFPCRVGEEKYCSKECGKEGSSKHAKTRSAVAYRKSRGKSVEVPCKGCGKPVLKFKSRLRYKNYYCTRTCYTQSTNVISPSSIEEKVASALDKAGIKYTQQYAKDGFVFDFKIGNTLLEVNGCYWHGCNKCYRTFNEVQKRKHKSDRKKRGYAKSKGVKLIEIWEHELDTLDIEKTLIKQNAVSYPHWRPLPLPFYACQT